MAVPPNRKAFLDIKVVQESMDAHAQRIAVAFLNWAIENALQGDHYGGVGFGIPMGPENTQDAYNQFIESLNNQHA